MSKSTSAVRRNRASAAKRKRIQREAIKAVQSCAFGMGVDAMEFKRARRMAESAVLAMFENCAQGARIITAGRHGHMIPLKHVLWHMHKGYQSAK